MKPSVRTGTFRVVVHVSNTESILLKYLSIYLKSERLQKKITADD